MLSMTLSTGVTLFAAWLAAGTVAPEPALETMAGPAVEISKKCPELRYVGREATFELTVTNRGGAAAQNVVVTDSVPATVEFISADGGGQREGGNVVWRLDKLDAGASKTLKVQVRCNQIATVKNSARARPCAESMAECEFPVRGVPAILLECVDDPDPVEIGNQTTYTITVTNQGTAVDTNIKVVATIPPELEFVKAGGATEGKADGATVRFAPVAT